MMLLTLAVPAVVLILAKRERVDEATLVGLAERVFRLGSNAAVDLWHDVADFTGVIRHNDDGDPGSGDFHFYLRGDGFDAALAMVKATAEKRGVSWDALTTETDDLLGRIEQERQREPQLEADDSEWLREFPFV